VSCSVHDVANLEERGIPSVFVASDQFRSAREAQSSALGTNPATVWVPHPIQDRTDDEMKDLARQVGADIVAALLESA
jgi:hypothetical protein